MLHPSHHPELRHTEPVRCGGVEHDVWWERCGEPVAYRSWATDWNPNTAVTLVPPDKFFSANEAWQLGKRWCDRSQKSLFTRNPKSHIARFMLFVEHSADVGWHLHGVAWVPTHVQPLLLTSGERWLAQEAQRYVDHALRERPAGTRARASACIKLLDSTEAAVKTAKYSTKLWNLCGKAEVDRLVLSGRVA